MNENNESYSMYYWIYVYGATNFLGSYDDDDHDDARTRDDDNNMNAQ